MLAVALPDAITFAIAGLTVLAGAVGVVSLRNPVHNALALVATLFGVSVLFVEQDAEFLAAVQVIVYAGAIVVLFLFVIMLLGVDRSERIEADPLRGQRPLAILLGLVVLAEILLLARVRHWVTGAHGVAGAPGGSSTNVERLARSVFTTYLLPFEVTSALLVIAVVGAVVLARRMPPARHPAAGADAPGVPGAARPPGAGPGSTGAHPGASGTEQGRAPEGAAALVAERSSGHQPGPHEERASR